MARNDAITEFVHEPELVRRMQLAESATYLLLLLLVVLYIRLLLRRQFCHPNLRFLLVSQPICHVAALTLRPIRHVLAFYGVLEPVSLKIINFASDSMLCVTFQIVLAYSVERMIAMIYVDTYEERWVKVPTLGIILFIGAMLSEVLLILVWYLGLNNFVAYLMQYTNFVIAAFFFVGLHVICKRAYKKVAAQKDSTVTQRFQTTRNLKAAHLLLHLAPFKCAANVAALYFYHHVFEEHEPAYFPLYSTYYFWFSQLTLACQMALTIQGHDCLREELATLCRGRSRIGPREITSVLGDRLVFSAEQTNQMYFEQIQRSWQIETKTHAAPSMAKYIK